MSDEPVSVLFACTANALRSPLAAALLQLRLGPLVHVESVGVRPGALVDGMAAAVADELGADILDHEPRGLEELLEEREGKPLFDLVITLSPEAHHVILDRLGEFAHEAEYWPSYDPSVCEGSREQRLEEYRLLRDDLDQRIAKRFARPSTA